MKVIKNLEKLVGALIMASYIGCATLQVKPKQYITVGNKSYPVINCYGKIDASYPQNHGEYLIKDGNLYITASSKLYADESHAHDRVYDSVLEIIFDLAEKEIAPIKVKVKRECLERNINGRCIKERVERSGYISGLLPVAGRTCEVKVGDETAYVSTKVYQLPLRR